MKTAGEILAYGGGGLLAGAIALSVLAMALPCGTRRQLGRAAWLIRGATGALAAGIPLFLTGVILAMRGH